MAFLRNREWFLSVADSSADQPAITLVPGDIGDYLHGTITEK
jgi:hypothetical protein